MPEHSMFRYVVPADDRVHVFHLTSGCGPVAVAAAADSRSVEFWSEHDATYADLPHAFRVFGTGQPLPDGARWIGTCARTAAGLVWHLYKVPVPGEGDQ